MVGFDDLHAEYSWPPLTTASHMLPETGRRAGEILQEMIDGGLPSRRSLRRPAGTAGAPPDGARQHGRAGRHGLTTLSKGVRKMRTGSCVMWWSTRLVAGALLLAVVALSAQAAPAQPAGGNSADWFPFTPPHDQFGPAMLDLRGMLNEPVAGSHGRIAAKDGDLVFSGNGQKVRFWGVVSEPWIWPTDKAQIDYMARRLAKNGVNLVRLHIARGDGPPTRFLDTVQYTVHALKQQGVYSYLSWFCTACYGDQTNRLYFDPEVQQEYQGWVRTILGSPNPYTGMPLAKDPAVAAVELIDEDSLFFWTFNPERGNLKARMPILEKLFGDWLKQKYGSLEKAVGRLGAGQVSEGRRLRRRPRGHVQRRQPDRRGLGHGRPQREARRGPGSLHDRDHAQLVRRHEEMDARGAGYDGLVVASNWKTADERVLGPLDQWTNLADDVTARNTYVSVGAKGPRAGYRIEPGQTYHDTCVMKRPGASHPDADPVRRHAAHHDRGRLGGPQPLPRRGAVPRRRLLLAAGHRRLLPLPRPARLVPEAGQVAHPGACRHRDSTRPPASSTGAATSRRAPSSSTTP